MKIKLANFYKLARNLPLSEEFSYDVMKTLPPSNGVCQMAQLNLADLYLRQRQTEDAEPLIRKVDEFLKTYHPADGYSKLIQNLLVSTTLALQVDLYQQQQKYDQAEDAFKKCAGLVLQRIPVNDVTNREMAEAYFALQIGRLKEGAGKIMEAYADYTDSVAWYTAHYGMTAPTTRLLLHKLTMIDFPRRTNDWDAFLKGLISDLRSRTMEIQKFREFGTTAALFDEASDLEALAADDLSVHFWWREKFGTSPFGPLAVESIFASKGVAMALYADRLKPIQSQSGQEAAQAFAAWQAARRSFSEINEIGGERAGQIPTLSKLQELETTFTVASEHLRKDEQQKMQDDMSAEQRSLLTEWNTLNEKIRSGASTNVFASGVETDRKLEIQGMLVAQVPGLRDYFSDQSGYGLIGQGYEAFTALKVDEALIDFLRFKRSIPLEPYDRPPQIEDHYAALVMKKSHDSKSSRIDVFDLGPAKAIDAQVDVLVNAMQARLISEPTYFSAMAAFTNLVWSKIATTIEGARKIYITPDSQLNRVSFAALPGKVKGHFLIEDVSIVYLTASRDLLRGRSPTKGNCLIIGDPNYNDSEPQPLGGVEPAHQEGRAAMTFGRLTNSLDELSAITNMLAVAGYGVITATGNSATEDLLLRSDSPYIIHMATHGFFSTHDIESSLQMQAHGVTNTDAGLEASIEQPKLRTTDDTIDTTLKRAGVALAGANYSHWHPGVTARDGILTAFEMGTLNLLNTELVVLSACDTGVGDPLGSQGVLGFRHALSIAGAKCQVLSLWRAPDESTKLLMIDFYRELLSGRSESQALVAAQRSYIQKKRASGFPLPQQWAGLTVSGDAE
jgi:CHAT domain-containing protein/tetratricopeptide (TPR) repeat protein